MTLFDPHFRFVCPECSFVTSNEGRAEAHPPECRHSFPSLSSRKESE